MKQYFLAFDFYNRDINKFFYGIITADLGDIDLLDIAKKVVDEKFLVNSLDVEIKITAFNNIS